MEKVTDYIGNFVYENTKLSFILTDEGRLVPDSSGFAYEYFIKDHLGNTRLTVKDSSGTATVMSEAHYYPFGLEINTLAFASPQQKTANRYLYNGKELQDDFALGWYDYGARFYDAGLGRWMRVDPLADLYWKHSPYNYVLNNPINAIDPEGQLVIFINGFTLNKKEQGTARYWREYDNIFVMDRMPTSAYDKYYGHYEEVEQRAFDKAVMHKLGDYNAMYKHGGNNISPLTRYMNGLIEGARDVEAIIKSITDENGNIVETIKIITHSMGAAYAKGYIKAIQRYIKKKGLKNVIISLEADFDPYQAKALEAADNVYTQQWWHDGFMADQVQKNVNEEAETSQEDKSKAHALMSFFSNIDNLEEGVYKWNGSAWVLQK